MELALGPTRLRFFFSTFFRFNPCSRGTRSRTKAIDAFLEGLSECFNPCSRGTRSRTTARLRKMLHPFLFQSLFSWNSLSDFAIVHTSRISVQFQSLFSWNSLSDAVGTVDVQCNVWFQSLFSWNSLSDLGSVSLKLARYSVSILVLVELALGQVDTGIRSLWVSGFQSLFSWNSLSDSYWVDRDQQL